MRFTGRYLWGLLLIGLGAIWTLDNMGVASISVGEVFSRYWPAILIIGGLSMLTGRHSFGTSSGVTSTGRSHLVVMSGGTFRAPAGAMEDLSITAVIGGPTIDLTAAWPEGGREPVIDISLVMGGANIYVPEGVSVVCEGTTIMGGVDLLGRGYGGLISTVNETVGTGPRIHIRVQSIMGGAKIRQRAAVHHIA